MHRKGSTVEAETTDGKAGKRARTTKADAASGKVDSKAKGRRAPEAAVEAANTGGGGDKKGTKAAKAAVETAETGGGVAIGTRFLCIATAGATLAGHHPGTWATAGAVRKTRAA